MNITSFISDKLSSLDIHISATSLLFFAEAILVVLAVNMLLYAFNFLRKIFFPSRYPFETPTTFHRFMQFIMNCVKLTLVFGLLYIGVSPIIAAVLTLIAICAIQITTDPMINAWHDKQNTHAN